MHLSLDYLGFTCYMSQNTLFFLVKPIWIEFPITWWGGKQESWLIWLSCSAAFQVPSYILFLLHWFLISLLSHTCNPDVSRNFHLQKLYGLQVTCSEPSPAFTLSSLLNTTNSVAPILISIEMTQILSSNSNFFTKLPPPFSTCHSSLESHQYLWLT